MKLTKVFLVASSLLISLFWVADPKAEAATYCLRADGTAAKAGALGPDTSAANCMSMTTHNASTFSPGDIIELSDQGGDFTTNLVVPSSGNSSSTIIYRAVAGETPVITTTATAAISIASKTFLTLSGLTINSQTADSYGRGVSFSGTSANITLTDLDITMPSLGYLVVSSGSLSNLTINNLTGRGTGTSRPPFYFYGAATNNLVVNGLTITGGEDLRFTSANGLSLTDISRTNCTGAYEMKIDSSSGVLTIDGYQSTGATGSLVYISNSNFSAGSDIKNSAMGSSTGYSFQAYNSSGFDFTDNVIDGGSFYVATSSAINFSGNLVKNNEGDGYYITGSHDIDFSGDESENNGSRGFFVAGSSYDLTFSSCKSTDDGSSGFYATGGSHDIDYDNCIVDGSGNSGYWADDTVYNLNYTACTAKNGLSDGFGVIDSAHDVTYNKCISYNNGDKNTTSDGDGFTAHLSNYNIYLNNCVAYNNTASGYAMVGNSSGHIYNSLAYHNAGDWSASGGLTQVRAGFYIGSNGANPTTGGAWTVKNSLGVGNYPREILLPLSSPNTLNYNLYQPTNASLFASVDGNLSTISWAAYATNEANSTTSDPLFNSPTSDFSLQYLSPAIDAGTDVSLTEDANGDPIYGAPDIGPYEYQPPFDITDDEINPTGNIRIYADGKYRYTSAYSGSAEVKLTVTPEAGHFSSSDRRAWMDISNISWGTTKEWTASSSLAGTTIFTVGGLTPNTYYLIAVDEATTTAVTGDTCIAASCAANSSGDLIFTYSGGYSTHTFTVSSDQTAPADFSLLEPENGTEKKENRPTFTWDEATDDSTGLAKYQFYLDGELLVDNLATTILSYEPSDDLSCGSHTWQVKAVNRAGNVSSSNVFVYKVSCRTSYSYTPAKVVVATSTPIAPTTGLSALATTQASFLGQSLALGSMGVNVKQLQRFLNQRGFIVAATGAGSSGQETEYFGTATRAAVIKFQTTYGLDPVGVVGPQTRQKISDLLATDTSWQTTVQSIQAQINALLEQIRLLKEASSTGD